MKNFIKTVKLFNTVERAKLRLLCIGILVGLILELVSIGSIIPMITYFSNFIIEEEDFIIAGINFKDSEHILALIILGIFVCKFVYSLMFIKFQSVFSYKLMGRISMDIYDHYSSSDYSISQDRDPSMVVRNCIREPTLFVGGIILPTLIIATEGSLAGGVLLLLLLYTPIPTISIILLSFLFALFIITITNPTLKSLGKVVQRHEAERISLVSTAMSGAKDFYLNGLSSYLLKAFSQKTNDAVTAMAHQNFMKQIIRYTLEFYMIVIIFLSAVIMSLLEMSYTNIISTLSLYVVSAFRILPSMNRIFVNLNTLSFNVASLDVVSNLLSTINQNKKMSNARPLQRGSNEWDRILLENVEFAYPGRSKMLSLTEVNFEVGNNYVLSGPSGSGKTSILDLILKLKAPTYGKVSYKYFDQEVDVNTIRNPQISYVPQFTTLLNGTILENITLEDFYNNNIDWGKLHEVAEVCGITAMLTQQQITLHSRVGEGGEAFSGGQRQLISLARALYRSPKLLILDEATSAMDKKLEEEILRAIMKYCINCCIISVTHNQKTAKLFSKHYQLIGGELVLST